MNENDSAPHPATSAAPIRVHTPYFGLCSVVLPLVILAAWILLESQPSVTKGYNGYAGLFLSIVLLVGTVVASGIAFICSAMALLRREGYMFLPIAGAIANLLICCWWLRML